VAYAFGLPNALRARGLTVEVVPGWETRSAGTFNPKGAVCHWTAGPAGSRTRPSLNICVNGRADLPGPLCNVYGARDGVAVVVAAGRANHAGKGGWKGLVGNSAVFGTEMEAAGVADFTAAQRWAYPRINAAYCDLGGFGADMVCGHSEWAGPRKTDINGYTMDAMRSQVAALLAAPEGDDMPLSDDDLNRLADRVWTRTPPGTGVTWPIHRLIGTDDKTGAIGRQLASHVHALSDADLARVAQAVNNERDRRDAALTTGELR
jgi:hypothetical protein